MKPGKYSSTMPKPTFFLKKPKATNETLVCMSFCYNNIRLIYSTTQNIHPKFWNAKTQRARENRSFPEYPDFNAYLEKLGTETLNFYRQCFINGQLPTPDQIREHLSLNVTFRAKLEPKAAKPTLFQFMEQSINEKKNSLSYGTTKTHTTTLNHLKNYAKERKIKLDFQHITIEFFYDFVQYLYAPPRELGANYAAKNIEILKQFLGEASEREYNENKAYLSKKFRISKEPVYDIHLSETELKQLLDLDLSDKPIGYKTVRDLFLIGCYTGLRFSDWSKVNPNQIQILDGVEFIKVTPDKTNKPVSIPLHHIVTTIFKVYKGVLPKSLVNQTTNRYLKELGEIAGFTEKITFTTNKAGKRIDIEKPKFELIGTHTARRSFATNAYLSGIEPLDIRSITGHKTEKEFLKYIKVDADKQAVRISKTAFFQKPETK